MDLPKQLSIIRSSYRSSQVKSTATTSHFYCCCYCYCYCCYCCCCCCLILLLLSLCSHATVSFCLRRVPQKENCPIAPLCLSACLLGQLCWKLEGIIFFMWCNHEGTHTHTHTHKHTGARMHVHIHVVVRVTASILVATVLFVYGREFACVSV